MNAKKLSIDANNPFRLIEKKRTFPTLCTIINDVRTFFRKNPASVESLNR